MLKNFKILKRLNPSCYLQADGSNLSSNFKAMASLFINDACTDSSLELFFQAQMVAVVALVLFLPDIPALPADQVKNRYASLRVKTSAKFLPIP